MRILDIDLDFFLDEIAHFRKRNTQRLSNKKYIPWNYKQVECFLEKQIGLSKENPVAGKIFVHHDEVFHFLSKELQDDKITGPFSLTHIDAHSDMATGVDGCFLYIMEELLRRPLKKRYDVSTAGNWEKLNPGNFIIYMAACSMLQDLTFVKHHKTNEKHMPLFFEDNNVDSNILQMKVYNKGLIKDLAMSTDLLGKISNYQSTNKGRRIKYKEADWCSYKNKRPFDRIFLTQSPSFTPSNSDDLIPVISQYMVL